jgi:competence protein ComEC
VSADASAVGPPPADLRLVPGAVASWLAALLVLLVPGPTGWVVPAVTAAVALAAAVTVRPGARGTRRRTVGAVVLAAAACACATSVAAGWRSRSLHDGEVARLAADQASGRFEVVLTGDPQTVRSRVRGNALLAPRITATARLERADARGRVLVTRQPVLLVAPADGWSDLLPGQRLLVDGRLRPADRTDPLAAVLTIRGPPQRLGRPSWVQRAAGRVRSGLRAATSGLGAEDAALVSGLVDGDTTGLPDEASVDFRAAGLTHLMAVSGANLAIVALALLAAGRWCGLRGVTVPLVAGAGVVAFAVVARPEPSVLRAAAMALLVMAAGLRGSSATAGPAALSAATLGLLLADPWLALSAGFALSVAATAGLVLLAPGWRSRWSARAPRRLAEALAVALAAQVATAPVLALVSPQVSVVSVLANVLAEPAVPVATVLGALAAVAAPLAPWVAWALAHLAAVPVAWIAWVAAHAAALPFAAVSWPQGLLGALAMVLVLVVGRVALPHAFRHPRLAAALVAVGAVLVAGPVPVPGRTSWPPDGWLAVACDVGQGERSSSMSTRAPPSSSTRGPTLVRSTAASATSAYAR